jgi:hypothetical protein
MAAVSFNLKNYPTGTISWIAAIQSWDGTAWNQILSGEMATSTGWAGVFPNAPTLFTASIQWPAGTWTNKDVGSSASPITLKDAAIYDFDWATGKLVERGAPTKDNYLLWVGIGAAALLAIMLVNRK